MTTPVTQGPHTFLPVPTIVIVTPHVLDTGHEGESAATVLVVQWDLLCPLARMHPLSGLGPATLQDPKLGNEKHTVPQWVIGGHGKWNHFCSTACFLAPRTFTGDTVPQ